MTMKQILNTILSNAKEKKFSINYEELKNYMKYEDYFYETILKPVANSKGYSVYFNKDKVIFKKKGE